MNKKIPLVVGITILFLGVGIQPAIAVIPKISDGEDYCDICPKKISKSHLVLIESLLNRLENYNYQLSEFTKKNPEINEVQAILIAACIPEETACSLLCSSGVSFLNIC